MIIYIKKIIKWWNRDSNSSKGNSRENYSGGVMESCKVLYKSNDAVNLLEERVDRAIINERLFLDSNLTLNQLASVVGSNRTYVSNIFSHKKDVRFSSYINHKRLEYAAKLDFSNLDVEEIADLSGFKSGRTFCRYLRSAEGEDLILLKKRYLCKK